MKTIEVTRLVFSELIPGLDEISQKLDNLNQRNPIDTVNWIEFGYKPEVGFSIGYTSQEILLKYYVREESFKAGKTESNDSVYEDSCVEFFFSPSDDNLYYNFEFNGIGTCLAGFGTERRDRGRIDPSVISLIRRWSSAGINPVKEITSEYSWEIVIAVPFDAFVLHKITELKGKTLRANFYKCGDRLKRPHYLTWNPIISEKPDYHRPEYFGLMKFI